MAPPKTQTNNRRVYAGPSRIHGSGLFARSALPAGTTLVEYDGPRVSAADGKALAASGNAFIFRLNRRTAIDGSVPWNLGRHANHSCDPNAASQTLGGRVWLRTLKSVSKGEEITYDYGYSFRDEPVPCRCGAAACPGVIVAARHRTRV